jgi:hypothetical protein
LPLLCEKLKVKSGKLKVENGKWKVENLELRVREKTFSDFGE